MERVLVRLRLNGRDREVWARPHHTLLQVLRDDLGATEVKYGCGEGVCSTCAVLLDGESVNACLLLAVQAVGRSVTTVKGLSGGDAEAHPLQGHFLRHGASQCGFCTPGMLMIAYEFLARHPSPTRREVREALGGNLCRCTGYTKIVDAVMSYASSQEAGIPPKAKADRGTQGAKDPA